MNMGEPLRIAIAVAKILEDLEIQYMIGGSMASSLFGVPRATQDVDFIIALEANQISSFCKKLEDMYYYSESMIQSAVLRNSTFNIIHLDTMYKIDVFVSGKDSESERQMTRRIPYEIEMSEMLVLYLTSPEDLIVEKLCWYNKGGRVSSRQLKDVEGIIKIQSHNLDWDYLRKFASERNVSELLSQF